MFDNNIMRLSGSKGALALCFACAVLNALLIMGQAAFLSMAITFAWEQTPTDALCWAAAFAACYALRHIAIFARDERMGRYANHAVSDLRLSALEGLYDAGREGTVQAGSGARATLLSEGIQDVRTYVGAIVPKLTELMVIPVLVGATLVVIDPISGVISLLLLPFVVFYMRMLGSYSKERAAKQRKSYDRLANRFADSLHGIDVLIAFGADKRETQQILSQGENLRRKTMDTLKAATVSSLVLDLFSVFALAAVAILLGFRLLSGDADLTRALIVLVAVPEIFAVVRRYASDFHASLDGANSLAALLELADSAPPVAGSALRPRTDAENSRSSAECEGFASSVKPLRLSLNDVGFCYPAADGAQRPDALCGISFDVASPMKVGIVGESGSGKSTLVRILAGLATPTAGSINATQATGELLDADVWRSRVLLIPQTPTIFSATLAQNVAFYAPNADRERIAQALERAGLESFARELPQGMDTPVGQGGRGLSGGQAQRVALARGFLCAERDVLIFDEPTAHLDVQTEASLKPAMLNLMEGKLTFVATHRLHWMRDMDLIIVLESGHIAQMGTLEQIEGTDGAYDRLAARLRGRSL